MVGGAPLARRGVSLGSTAYRRRLNGRGHEPESLVRSAIRGWATYRLPWFDAHVWAYAHEYGLAEIYSEDFQHDRHYGTVRVIDRSSEMPQLHVLRNISKFRRHGAEKIRRCRHDEPSQRAPARAPRDFRRVPRDCSWAH